MKMTKSNYGSNGEDSSDAITNSAENVGSKIHTDKTPLLGSAPVTTLNEPKISGYVGAWSRLSFSWFTPVLFRGNEKQKLDPGDLDLVPLPTDCDTENVTKAFEEYWHQELQNNSHSPSIVKAIFRAFGPDYISAGALKLIHDLCIFVGPQVLRRMINYLRQPSATNIWHGLVLTAAVTASQVTMSLCLRHYFFKCYNTGLRIRTAVITAIYKKALVVSAEERQTRSLGEITNLMSIDAQKLQDLTTYLHSVWSSPLQIALALYFLWKELGPSSLGGCGVIVVMIPVTKKVSQWMASKQKNLMKAKDRRVELNEEVLAGMKVIKLQAWEEAFQQRILALRQEELNQLFRYYVGTSFSRTLWIFTPLAVAIASFAVYVMLGNKLDVATALTSLALFDILRFPLFMLPQVINSIVEAFISLKRVRSFLMCKEHHAVGTGTLHENGVEIENICASYGNDDRIGDDLDVNPVQKQLAEKEREISLLRAQLDEAETEIRKYTGAYNSGVAHGSPEDMLSSPLCLRRIKFHCQAGEFIAIVGGVGCGKSSLLKAVLGELQVVTGSVCVKGKLAYFSQSPFLMNATLRDNILFGHVGESVDEALYQRCLDCCALRPDLALLPDGDETEIGEKGITLSGGQKARIALARAVYHRADISIVDDALSAVDAHVAKHLFEAALIGELLASSPHSNSPRSVILVTNALQYLSDPRVNRIVVMNNGRIVEEGTFSKLVADSDSVFSRYMAVIDENGMSKTKVEQVSSEEKKLNNDTQTEATITTSLKVVESRKPSTLMTEEVREIGHVGRDVYLSWARAAGGIGVPILFFVVFIIVESIAVTSNWWLTFWSAHKDEGSQIYFLGVYAALGTVTAVAALFRMIMLSYFGLKASSKLFSDMLEVVLHAKMSFFDTTPTGRLVNRFSKDIFTTDERLTETMRTYFATLFSVLSTVVVISGVTPVFAICLIPMAIFYINEQAFFTLTYRELKRLDSSTRSPIFALLGESVDGAAVIRAFSAQDTLFTRFTLLLTKQQHAYFLTCAAQSWLAVRLELIGTLIVTFACLSAVFEHLTAGENTSFAGLAGLAISYSLSVTQSLNYSVRMASDMEATMVSVERIRQYTNIESEGERKTSVDDHLPQDWPVAGAISFQGVKLRYRPGLPLVLQGLDIDIPAGSKIGVVGRTGAGKSTLMTSLLRIVELDQGKILIDGTDIRTVGLAKLRSSIAVIPQDPVLFSGTVRSNLDPFDENTDEALFDALRQVGLLKAKVAGSSNNNITSLSNARIDSLENNVLEGGSNFSVGQRQLLVIARALLSGTKIVIMDEATASIDAETDAAIQKSLRSAFANATCITVAHRLNTIMDSDLILVMDNGKAAEFDTPKNLIKKGGMFKQLLEAAVH